MGASDAFVASFFGQHDVKHRTAYNKCYGDDSKDIGERHGLGLERMLTLELLVLSDNEDREDRRNGKNDSPAKNGHPNSTEGAAREQRSKEEYQEYTCNYKKCHWK